MIRAIVALDLNRGIAKDGKIPWDLPEDRQYFKEKTMGAVVLMGRGTYDTLPGPLPGRTNLVLTHTTSLRQGFIPVKDLAQALQQYPNLWIIGGAEIYAQALPFCEELFITHIPGNYDCDQFFPDFQSQYTLAEKHGPFAVYTKE